MTTLLIGDKCELVMHMRRKGQRWYALCCFGWKRHYRKDGTCKHTDLFMASLKPKYRRLTKVQPFGGKS